MEPIKAEFLGEITDSRAGTGKVQDELGASHSARKKGMLQKQNTGCMSNVHELNNGKPEQFEQQQNNVLGYNQSP